MTAAAAVLNDRDARKLYGQMTGQKMPDRKTFYRWRTDGVQIPGLKKRKKLRAKPAPTNKRPFYTREDIISFAAVVGPAAALVMEGGVRAAPREN